MNSNPPSATIRELDNVVTQRTGEPPSTPTWDAAVPVTEVLESITDAFIVLDHQWRFTYLNRRAEEIIRPLHKTRRDLVGRDLWQEFPDLVGTVVEQNYRRAMAEKVKVEFELFYEPLQSWFEIRVFPAVNGLTIYSQDITARKKADEELRQQREWFQVTLSSIGDSVIATDNEARVTFLNPTAEAMTGWRSAEACGLPLDQVFNIVHEETRAPAPNPVVRVLREGITVGLANHTALISRDGREIPIEDSAAPIKDAAGNIRGAVMVFHDVTERRQAERALRQSNERVRNILDSISDGFSAVDRDWRIVYLNPRSAERLRRMNRTREDVMGKNLWDEFPDLRGTPVEQSYRRAMEEKVKVEFELFYPPLQAWFELRIYPSEDGLSVFSQDITERKRAEEEIRRQREWFRVTLSSIGDAVIATDAEGRVTFINPIAETMTGWTGGAAVGKPLEKVFNIINEYTRHRAPNPVERALREGVIVGLANHTALIARNGHETPIEDSAAPIKDTTGKVVGAVMVFHDVSEQRRAQRAMRETHERISNILESITDAFSAVDKDWRITFLNRRALELLRPLQKQAEDLVGRVLWDEFPDLRGTIYEHSCVRALREQVKVEFELYYPPLDTWFDVRVYPTRDGLCVYSQVITDRKNAEDALRKRERQLRLVTDAAPVMLAHCSPDYRYLFVNQAYAARFGLTRDDVVGKQIPEIVGEAAFAKFRGYVDQALAGQRQTFEVEIPYAQLGPHWMRCDYVPEIAEDGTVRSMVAVVSDVTDVVKARQTMAERKAELEKLVNERTASLQQIIAQMEEFSYSVSHDLRAPLRAIQGYAKAVLEDYADRLDEEGRDYLQRIVAAGTRMDRLTQDVLTYSKIARGPIRAEPVCLDKLIPETVQQYAPEHAAAGRVRIERPLPAVLGNEPLLVQAISNLLDNAVKFVPPGTAPQVRICAEAVDNAVRLWIEDNGIGIPPEHQARIWGIFERVHPKHEYEGTGIGLAIVRKAIERMGGRVGVESDGRSGSRFWIQLPAQ